MSAHPVYPTARDLRIEAIAESIIMADLAAAEEMRSVLRTAAEKIRDITFRCGWPVAHYERDDVLGLLADMEPQPESARAEKLWAAAYDFARDSEAERDRDAAEYRAELAREDAP